MCELVCEAMKVQDMIQRGKSRVNVSALALECDGVQELAASFTLLRSCAAPWTPESLTDSLVVFQTMFGACQLGTVRNSLPLALGRSLLARKGSSTLWRELLVVGLDCQGDFSIHLAGSPCHRGLFSQGLES